MNRRLEREERESFIFIRMGTVCMISTLHIISTVLDFLVDDVGNLLDRSLASSMRSTSLVGNSVGIPGFGSSSSSNNIRNSASDKRINALSLR
jgi:hypothetical protein